MYNSEYCDVFYNEEYNIVFVKWKNFVCLMNIENHCFMI